MDRFIMVQHSLLYSGRVPDKRIVTTLDSPGLVFPISLQSSARQTPSDAATVSFPICNYNGNRHWEKKNMRGIKPKVLYGLNWASLVQDQVPVWAAFRTALALVPIRVSLTWQEAPALQTPIVTGCNRFLLTPKGELSVSQPQRGKTEQRS